MTFLLNLGDRSSYSGSIEGQKECPWRVWKKRRKKEGLDSCRKRLERPSCIKSHCACGLPFFTPQNGARAQKRKKKKKDESVGERKKGSAS